jgi:uncharacterized membrane protein
MNTNHTITKLARKALLSGGLALAALALATGTAHADTTKTGGCCGGSILGSGGGKLHVPYVLYLPRVLLHDVFDYKEGGRN